MSEITIVLSTSSLNQMRFKLILEEVIDFSTTHPMEHKKIIKNVQIGSPHFHYVDLSGTKGKYSKSSFRKLICKAAYLTIAKL